MKITLTQTQVQPTQTVTTSSTVTIRDDWQDNYVFAEEFAPNGRKQLSVSIAATKEVRAVEAIAEIPARAAIPADPVTGQSAKLASPGRPGRAAVEAVAPTQAVKFVLWDVNDFPKYDGLNGGEGYGKSDIDKAIDEYLDDVAV